MIRIASLSRHVGSLAWAASAALACLPAHAVPVVYTTQASFLAAVSNPGVDTFDDFSNSVPTPSPITRMAGAYGYRAAVSTTVFYGAGSGPDHWLSPNTATDTITFDAFTGGVAGIGGFFFGTALSGGFTPVSSITIVATDASGSTSRTLVDPTLTTFLGFVSGSAITSLTVATNQPAPTTFVFAAINDLVLARAAGPRVVPEPHAAALLGLGLLAAWRARRRSRA